MVTVTRTAKDMGMDTAMDIVTVKIKRSDSSEKRGGIKTQTFNT